VSERRDDTTNGGAESRPARGSYYYDDATGYETYTPDDEEDEETGREGDGKKGGSGDGEKGDEAARRARLVTPSLYHPVSPSPRLHFILPSIVAG
jgi:hypothetical protein